MLSALSQLDPQTAVVILLALHRKVGWLNTIYKFCVSMNFSSWTVRSRFGFGWQTGHLGTPQSRAWCFAKRCSSETSSPAILAIFTCFLILLWVLARRREWRIFSSSLDIYHPLPHRYRLYIAHTERTPTADFRIPHRNIAIAASIFLEENLTLSWCRNIFTKKCALHGTIGPINLGKGYSNNIVLQQIN